MKVDILLTEDVLIPERCSAFVATHAAGGTVLFIGTVRSQTRGEAVLRLEFEAYASMAVSEMQKIADVALQRFAVESIAMHHRTGILYPGDVPVVIAVSAPHRAAAFDACCYCIDTLKQTVPIWKREILESGAVWVSAHP